MEFIPDADADNSSLAKAGPDYPTIGHESFISKGGGSIMANIIEMPSPIIVDSKERVAFDLAVKIDSQTTAEGEKDKAYWLTLYSQCLRATRGWAMEDILKEETTAKPPNDVE